MKFSIVSALVASYFLMTGGIALADPPNINVSAPAKDAAYVLKMKGLVNNLKIVCFDEIRQNVNDGIVIRGSYVKDGKVVIPPHGLFTTSRCENWWSFDDQTFTMDGKIYHFITDEYDLDVVKNVVMKPGDIIYSDASKTRGWTMSKIRPDGWGRFGNKNKAYSATISFIKATGNYYGQPFYVIAGNDIKSYVEDGQDAKGTGFAAGSTASTSFEDTSRLIVGIKHVSVGRSSVTVDELSDKEAKVKELVVPRTSMALISPNAPVVGIYAKGDSFRLGKATVEVADVTADSVTVKISDGKGVVTKTLGASQDQLDQLPSNRAVCKKLYAQSSGGSEVVHVNIYNKGGYITDGKVALVGYSDVLTVKAGDKWATDNRFIVRPETCASCSFIHEIMIENADAIVLDEKNNVFNGPDGYFKIIIDKMEGDTIKSWHIETAKDKTGNLAARAKGKHIDVVVGATCRSTAPFFRGAYANLYKEAVSAE